MGSCLTLFDCFRLDQTGTPTLFRDSFPPRTSPSAVEKPRCKTMPWRSQMPLPWTVLKDAPCQSSPPSEVEKVVFPIWRNKSNEKLTCQLFSNTVKETTTMYRWAFTVGIAGDTILINFTIDDVASFLCGHLNCGCWFQWLLTHLIKAEQPKQETWSRSTLLFSFSIQMHREGEMTPERSCMMHQRTLPILSYQIRDLGPKVSDQNNHVTTPESTHQTSPNMFLHMRRISFPKCHFVDHEMFPMFVASLPPQVTDETEDPTTSGDRSTTKYLAADLSK